MGEFHYRPCDSPLWYWMPDFSRVLTLRFARSPQMACIVLCTMYHQHAAAWNAARWGSTEGTRAAAPSRRGLRSWWPTHCWASRLESLSWATQHSARCHRPSRPCLLNWHSSTCATSTVLCESLHKQCVLRVVHPLCHKTVLRPPCGILREGHPGVLNG